MRVITACSLALLLSGCSAFGAPDAEVESNTTWSGSFTGRTVDGSGNQTVKLTGSSPFCASVQKQTKAGFLTVSIGGHSNTTTAEFGVVTVCD